MVATQTAERESSTTYVCLRRGMFLIALLFPLILWLGGGLIFDLPLQTSMSFYYHTGMRDIFVGVLGTIGTFLFLYRPKSSWENRWLNVAGFSAMGVALFAMNPLGDCRPPDSDSGLALHGTFAAVFFAAIAVVCGWFPARHWVLSYLCAGVIAFCIVVALVYIFILPLISLEWKESLCRVNVFFKLEAADVWAFCAY